MTDEIILRPFCVNVTVYAPSYEDAVKLGVSIAHNNQRESVSCYPLAAPHRVEVDE